MALRVSGTLSTRYFDAHPALTENTHIFAATTDDNTIIALKLLSLKAGYTCELTWHYRSPWETADRIRTISRTSGRAILHGE